VSDTRHDLIIIGGGPGGYVAALRAAQLGLSTALIEKRSTLGGTCLNVGCIPAKALLDSSEFFSRIRDNSSDHGISVGDLSIDIVTMQKRKQAVVDRLTAGIATLMKKRKVAVVMGIASLEGPGRVSVSDGSGAISHRLEAASVVLATGSVPTQLPFLPFDGTTVVTSTEALTFDTVPEKLVVVGAGAIGLELGSAWSRFGSDVTVVELMETILPGWDAELSATLARELRKQKITLRLGHSVTGMSGAKGNKKAQVLVKTPKKEEIKLEADRVLVAVGRRPYYDGVGIEKLGVTVSASDGRIEVDRSYRTSAEGVYAIGDLIHGPMLAHKAEEEGVAVAEIIAGGSATVNYEAIPGVVYTWPECATVGRSEEELGAAGIKYRSGSFSFRANGRALAMGSDAGSVKILSDAGTDAVLGVHIVGPWASDLISEAVTVMEFGGSAEDIARSVHAHPTLSEAIKEAAMAVDGWSIHSI
jgi:dihydrolipoamide dehydrogenase